MKRYYLTAAVVCTFSAGSALSCTELEQAGTGTGTSTSSVTQIADGFMVMQISSTYDTVEMEDASHPMHGASGPCIGAVEIDDGIVDGAGICTFTDAAGNKVVLHWDAEEMEDSGALAGTWHLSGGTGPWENTEGGGDFSSLTDPETGKFVNTISSSMIIH